MAKQSTYFITFQKLGSKKQYKLKVNGHINPLHYIFEELRIWDRSESYKLWGSRSTDTMRPEKLLLIDIYSP